jgi:hypothetical protein
VGGDVRLLLEHAHPQARVPLEELAGCGEPDDAGADDGDVAISRRVNVCAGHGGQR